MQRAEWQEEVETLIIVHYSHFYSIPTHYTLFFMLEMVMTRCTEKARVEDHVSYDKEERRHTCHSERAHKYGCLANYLVTSSLHILRLSPDIVLHQFLEGIDI